MLIDTHCHIPHKKYGKTPREVIEDSVSAGVEKFISIGTSFEDNESVSRVSTEFKEVYCSFGIYPHENEGIPLGEIEKKFEIQLKTHIGSKKLVAVGECGLDINPGGNLSWQRSLGEQIELFDLQVKIAREFDLPVILHNKNGNEQVLSVLEKYSGVRGVAHCFSQNWGYAQKLLNLGFYLSFSAMITYPNKAEILEVAQKVPLDRFVLETDAPYLPPQNRRGEPNFPKNVKIVAEKVAEVRKTPFEEICKMSVENSCTLFKL